MTKRTAVPRGDHAVGRSAGAGTAVALLARAAGVGYWPASILAVLVGGTLPFWLRPNGFEFAWLRLVETLLAAVLIHAASSLVSWRERGEESADALPVSPLPAAIACYVVGAALGLHLNAVTPGNLILTLGTVCAVCGFLYSASPVRLSARGLGEVVIGVCLGVLPVAISYYAQTGRISAGVYLAALPTALALVLWLWVCEIRDFDADHDAGRKTLVVLLGRVGSARVIVPVLSLLTFASLFAAVFTASMIPLALVAVLAFGLVRTVVAVSWNHHGSRERMAEALDSAYKLHIAVGVIVAASALAAIGS